METFYDEVVKEYVGSHIGRMTVNEIVYHRDGLKKYVAKCTCDCGKPFEIRLINIRHRGKISCGCTSCTDIGLRVGERVGNLVVDKHFFQEDGFGKVTENVSCTCDCGNPYVFLRVDQFGVGENDRCCHCRQSRRISAGHQKIEVSDWKYFMKDLRPIQKEKLKRENWTKNVWKRYGYTCQCCGATDDLEAHHIINYSRNKKQRYQLSNGVTLCHNCHSDEVVGSFHHIYGNKYNTLKQLKQFIADKNYEFGGVEQLWK